MDKYLKRLVSSHPKTKHPRGQQPEWQLLTRPVCQLDNRSLIMTTSPPIFHVAMAPPKIAGTSGRPSLLGNLIYPHHSHPVSLYAHEFLVLSHIIHIYIYVLIYVLGNLIHHDPSPFHKNGLDVDAAKVRQFLGHVPGSSAWIWSSRKYPLVNIQKTMENHHVQWENHGKSTIPMGHFQ